MKHDFHDTFISREHQFSAGVEKITGKHYVSFTVTAPSRRIEYEVYYELPATHTNGGNYDPRQLLEFVDQCRQGLHENLILTV
jgi:hypothetical protein